MLLIGDFPGVEAFKVHTVPVHFKVNKVKIQVSDV